MKRNILNFKYHHTGILVCLLIAASIFTPQNIFAATTTTTQEESTTETTKANDEEKNTKSSFATGQAFTNFMNKYFSPLVSKNSFIFTGGLTYMLSTGDVAISAPSPIIYSLGIGYSFKIGSFFIIQPRLTGWMQFYSWDADTAYAYPAEVEFRTATVFSFMIDIPFIISLGTEKNSFEFGAGLGILPRFGILSNDVSASDTGTSGTAESDVAEINSWLWSNARYLYPEAVISYTRMLKENWHVGAEYRFYLPLGSLVSGHGMDSMMMTFALRLSFQL